jgi:methylated-DNA-protein-cysteine methyltransferase related protein
MKHVQSTQNLNERHVDFFESVYAIVLLIPFGRVTNYGSIAKVLGSSRSSRMVGWAMNACHDKPEIPAHRVVNRQGLLTGKMHFETINTMQTRLESEGIIVVNDQIVNFKSVFWNPLEITNDFKDIV